MNCNQIKDQLELYVLDGLDGKERETVETHLCDCAACREQVGGLTQTMGSFKATFGLLGKSVDLRQFHKRAYAEIDGKRVGFRWHVVLAKAAALMILCGAALFVVLHYHDRGGAKVCGCEPWMQAGIHADPEWGAVYPLVRENRVFAMKETPDGLHLAAFDKRSGKPLWETPYAIYSAPDTDDKHLVAWVMSSRNEFRLVSVDADTGKLIWSFKPDTAIDGAKLSRPLLFKNGVCWTDGKRINLVNASNGSLLWSNEVDVADGLSLPVTDEKNIYVASVQALFAFDRKTGMRVWVHQYETPTPTWLKRPSMLTTAGGKVLAARAEMAPKGMLYCHDAGMGGVVWSKPTSAPISMLVSGGKVFVRTGVIEAFNLSDGHRLWSVKEAGCSPLTIADNKLYVVAGQDKRRISAFDMDSGKQLKIFELPGPVQV